MKWLDDFLSMMEAGINHANNQSDLGIATTIPLDAFEFSETKNFLNAKVNITRDDFGTHTVEVEIARLRVSPLNDDFEDDEITQDGALLTNEQWQIAFYVDGSMVDATGEGYEMQIIAVVQAAVEYFLNMYRPLRIKFHAADHEGYMGKIKVRGSQERVGGRERVYRIFARGLTRKYGYTDFSEGRDFLLVRDDEAQGEVFDPAGGKKGFQLGYIPSSSFEESEGISFLKEYNGDFGASGNFEDDCGYGWDEFKKQQFPLYHGSRAFWEGDFQRERAFSDFKWGGYRRSSKKGPYTRGKISGLPLEGFFLAPHPVGSFYYLADVSDEGFTTKKERLNVYYLAKGLEIWDYRNPNHVKDLVDCTIQNSNLIGRNDFYFGRPLPDGKLIIEESALYERLSQGDWADIQHPLLLDCMRFMGFDGFINYEEYDLAALAGDDGVNGLSLAVFHNQALITENQLYDIYLEICGDQ